MVLIRSSYWSPYFGGIIIGLLQIPVFFIDASLGSSGSLQTLIYSFMKVLGYDPAAFVLTTKSWWQVGFVVGITLGAWLSSKLSNSIRPKIPAFWENSLSNYSITKRYLLAFIGGFLIIFGARIAGGCTMGNGVSGVSLLSVGSVVVIMAMFLAGILSARFYKK